MKNVILTVLALWLATSLAAAPRAQAATSSSAKKYNAEHHARLNRHQTRTPAQRHARMVKYSAEHRARQHRHRAHLKNKRKAA
jgi:Ni/Co efflux regulator RcnB